MTRTGRQRHRPHKLFGGSYVCILQFEYEFHDTSCEAGIVSGVTKTEWYDARPAQLTEEDSTYVTT